MPKIAYKKTRMRADSFALVEKCNAIIADYTSQGLRLTLRQLYYQLVAANIIPNKTESYDKLGDVIGQARLGGLIDWLAVEDRTRNLKNSSHWSDPSNIIDACERSYQLDRWRDQEYRVEVWVEKEALAGVVDQIVSPLDVPYMACRGYMSLSEMWEASQRLLRHCQNGQKILILHLGDHDPSGIDMSRDIEDRLNMFGCGELEFKRIALNMPQVRQFRPPPNPAKTTDARFKKYQEEFGEESWELDALKPTTLRKLITEEVMKVRDEKKWKKMLESEENDKVLLKNVSERWSDVCDFLED
jgi:hypothetical protein